MEAELYCPSPGSRKWPAPVRYAVQAIGTAVHVARKHPTDILFTNPPVIAGVVLIVIGRLIGARVWADSHSGAFNDPRWTRFAAVNYWVTKRCAGVIVTNEPLAATVKAKQGRPFVLNLVSRGPVPRDRGETDTVLAPMSYSFDEPIRELLAAVSLVPEMHVTLTGRAPDWVVDAAPRNCKITGWLATQEYERRLSQSAGVICLTTRELTMQMGAFEALEYGLPILATGTTVLRDYLNQGGVVFADDHDPATLADALRGFWKRRDELMREAGVAQRVMFERARRELGELETALASENHGRRGPRNRVSDVDVG